MSALTYNVSSKYVFTVTPLFFPFPNPTNLTRYSVKMIIILTYGWVSENKVFTIKDGTGILLALGGATAYSQLSQK